MDNQRLFLFIALSLVIMLLFSAWQEQFGPKPSAIPSSSSAPHSSADLPATSPDETPLNQGPSRNTQDIPTATPSIPQSADTAIPKTATTSGVLHSVQRVHVTTDLLDVEIDSVGGDIRRAALLAYPEQLDIPNKPVQLLDDRMPRLYIAQSGLLAIGGQNVDHHQIFSSSQSEYTLGSEQQLQVTLSWQSDDGLRVEKIYTFMRNSYVIGLDVRISNQSAQDWSGRMYRQFQRTQVAEKSQSSFIYTFMGGVVSYENNKYEKINFEDMAEWKPEVSYAKGGWVAMIQHYFLSAWIPGSQDEFNSFYTKALDDGRYIIGMTSSEKKIAAGAQDGFSSKIFIGPKEQHRLENVAPNLQLVVDYGVLTILADPLFWLLEKIHNYVHNWGWSIIIVTLLIKLLFYKLSEAAYRSMANMRKFQPKIQQLRERYGNDRQRMSQAMMDLYKKEKINPLGGCLPMLVQIPVFIALYWVLLESVELRQAHFIFWIDDLSTKDPYYVLPVIMGLSMFIQQKLNPAPMDPMQQKILQFLPLIFTLFFAFFPSGLVLYWVANNILSIIQQWYITRKIEAQPSK